MDTRINKWSLLIIVVALMFIVASLSSYLITNTNVASADTILVIPLNGPIGIDNGGGDLFSSSTVGVDGIIKQLREADKNPNIKAIVLEINSPGGSAVASAELAYTVKTLNKTTYAVIRDVGASGAYWVATATDKIIASPMSITGSVGVISSYLEFSNLFEKYGIDYERLVAGKYKDMGTPYKELTAEERRIMERKLNDIHKIFLQDVAVNRKLTQQQINKISTGEFFLGTEAKELGLVDVLLTKEQAITLIKQEINQPNAHVVEKKEQTSFLDVLAKQIPLSFGRGFAAEVLDRNNQEMGIQAR
ncbi:MAG: signal peptide peptidase SppA [Candidatus Nanoarchaeia archaeon]